MTGLAAVVELAGVEQHYAWGSPTLIPELLGTIPGGRPVAELWFGAHESHPSRVHGQDVALDELVAADPTGVLGPQVVERFGGRLPFLVKLLAAESALSIQVHPTLEQARAGFAAENERGLAPDDPKRNYRDANHKPELLCALTPFEALCGFRPVEATLQLLDALACTELEPVRRSLLTGDLRGAFTWLLGLPEPVPVVRSVLEHAQILGDDLRWGPTARALGFIGSDFPDDIGIALAVLLNHVRLQPGEAIYLGAGNLHCYLRGMGVEVMANSDNVLRCGLTPKHVEIAELLKVTDFAPLAEPRCKPDWADGMSTDFRLPVPDFSVFVVDLDGYRKPGQQVGSCATGTAGLPYLVLCTSGGVQVDVAGTQVMLAPGQAAFVAAREALFTLRGTGRTFLTTVGELAGQI